MNATQIVKKRKKKTPHVVDMSAYVNEVTTREEIGMAEARSSKTPSASKKALPSTSASPTETP
jgi:hypothetical protein